jgi:hypothetical protein
MFSGDTKLLFIMPMILVLKYPLRDTKINTARINSVLRESTSKHKNVTK